MTIVLTVLLVVVWVLAWGDISLANVVSGIALAIVLLLAFPAARHGRSRVRMRPIAAARYLVAVLWNLVVSNVGVQLFGAVEAFTDDEWRWVLDVNVVGSARVARAFLPLLRRASESKLVFTTSSSILDPASRLTVWEEMRRINAEGTTVFLTTQYLEEADQLCNRLAIIDDGLIVREGTPAQLKADLRQRQGLDHDPTLDEVFLDATGRTRELIEGQVQEVR